MCNDGLVVDLSSMRSVRVDQAAGTVRAEGGVTIGELDRETQLFGLAVPMGVVTETGIAGLTLGGGLGWLRRKYGLSCDNLVSVDVVTADGRVITADAEREPELFWGIQGGGGNFGVVTSFEFRAHPVGPDVFLAFVVHAGIGCGRCAALLRSVGVLGARRDQLVRDSLARTGHGGDPRRAPRQAHRGVSGDALRRPGLPAKRRCVHCATPAIPSPTCPARMPYLDVQKFFDEDYPAH